MTWMRYSDEYFENKFRFIIFIFFSQKKAYFDGKLDVVPRLF